jgi:hypothetical protein
LIRLDQTQAIGLIQWAIVCFRGAYFNAIIFQIVTVVRNAQRPWEESVQGEAGDAAGDNANWMARGARNMWLYSFAGGPSTCLLINRA